MKVKKGLTFLLALGALAAMALAPSGAQAGHGPSDAAWIAQAGNGEGLSVPLIRDFEIRTMLFNAQRFPNPNGVARDGFGQWAGWGLIPTQSPLSPDRQVAFVTSNDGVRWTEPNPVFIEDPDGNDVPFIINDPRAELAVVYGTIPVLSHPSAGTLGANLQIGIYYKAGPATGATASIGDLHVAVSEDGVNFGFDQSLRESAVPAEQVLAAGTFKESSRGSSQVIFQSGSATCATAPVAANFPWNCQRVMVYHAVDAAGLESTAVAGSNNGVDWRGLGAPVLAPDPAAWDSDSASYAEVSRMGSTFVMTYSGAMAPSGCIGGTARCYSIGRATSADGLVWTKSASNPAVPRSILEEFSPDDPSTLTNVAVVDDAPLGGDSHDRLLLARVTDAGQFDTYLAYESPAPINTPMGQIAQPKPVNMCSKFGQVPIEVYVTDTLGAPIGLNMATVAMSFDGVPFAAPWQSEDSLVQALKLKAQKVTGSASLAGGPHTFEFKVKDVQANELVLTSSFFVDTQAPASTLTNPPPSPAVRTPLSGIGTVGGSSTEAATGVGLQRIEVEVTNPLSMVKRFRIPDGPNNTQITKVNTHNWDWSWVSPSLDPHLALPGEYRVSGLGVDLCGNVETPSPANTTTVIVL